MKSILVPTDFSPCATNAIHFAASFCKDHSYKMEVLHVMHMPIPDAFTPTASVNSLINSKREETNEKLLFLSESLRSEYGLDITSTATFGLASDAILEKSKELQPQLVIMGTTGESGFLDSLLGSITSAVACQSSIPVLAIPEHANYDGFQTIVFGEDHQEETRREMSFMHSLLPSLDSCIHVVSIQPKNNEYVQEIICDEGRIRQVSLWAPTVLSGLKYYIEQEDADLLTVKHRPKGIIEDLFQKSTTKTLLKASTVPLLIFQRTVWTKSSSNQPIT